MRAGCLGFFEDYLKYVECKGAFVFFFGCVVGLGLVFFVCLAGFGFVF